MATPKNHYLRHSLATIAYRFQSSVHEAGDDFGDFTPGHDSRTVCEIINHMSHLLNASAGIIREETFNSSRLERLNFLPETDRFISELIDLDKMLIEKDLNEATTKRLLQGPISDILTHIGQLSLMRRLNGNPVERSGFSKAPISIGKLSYF